VCNKVQHDKLLAKRMVGYAVVREGVDERKHRLN
jgi:hypothetical protein